MRKLVKVVLPVAVAALLLAGCGGQPNEDNDTEVTGRDVSKIEKWHFYTNTDNWPNVECIVIGGVAFATTSTRTSDADTAKSPVLIKVEEWKGVCPNS